jgi:hypothetical protein
MAQRSRLGRAADPRVLGAVAAVACYRTAAQAADAGYAPAPRSRPAPC